MKLYWPCAVYLKENRLERAFTYDAMNSLAEARQQIETWKDWYKFDVRKAWVDVYDHGVKTETIHISHKDGSILSTESHEPKPESNAKEESHESAVLHLR